MAKKPTTHNSRLSKLGGASKAVKAAEKRGFSQKQIAKSAGRSESTISDIKTGRIAKPPKGVMKGIRSLKKNK